MGYHKYHQSVLLEPYKFMLKPLSVILVEYSFEEVNKAYAVKYLRDGVYLTRILIAEKMIPLFGKVLPSAENFEASKDRVAIKDYCYLLDWIIPATPASMLLYGLNCTTDQTVNS